MTAKKSRRNIRGFLTKRLFHRRSIATRNTDKERQDAQIEIFEGENSYSGNNHDFCCCRCSYSFSNLPGFIQRGTYTRNGHHIAFINIGIVKDLNYWQVMVLSRRDDKVAGQAAERIIQSVQIDYPS